MTGQLIAGASAYQYGVPNGLRRFVDGENRRKCSVSSGSAEAEAVTSSLPTLRHGEDGTLFLEALWDERYDIPLPARCPNCAGPITRTGIATQYQEELPVTRVVVRQFDIHVGRCGPLCSV